ncbi:MAG TPA: tripartite tricarboxylate transporter TctB family protein [Kiloniellaceae bacterium]
MQQQEESGKRLVSTWTADIVVAAIMAFIGGIVMMDSVRLGMGWSEYGPESGYFPFYIGLAITGTSLCTIAITVFSRSRDGGTFVERQQFADVLKVLVPSAIFVIAIGFIGIYVSAALFIGAFMRWLGRFPWYLIAIVSLTVPFALFLLFEIWFLVPLPKGPLEDFLGY